MPPPPELGDGTGDIGIVEVAHELKAQHPAQAHGHIGIAGEVKVELKRKGRHAQPGPGGGELCRRQGLIGIPQQSQIVGQQDLFGQAHHKDLHAGGELFRRMGTVVDLIPQVLVFDNGARDELWKQGDERTEVDEIFLYPGVAAVHVDGIAHGLEGVEGDADGQAQTQPGHEGQPDGGQAPGHKVPVFEKEQQRQVENHGRGHRPAGRPVIAAPLAAFHQHAVGVVNGNGGKHDEDIHRLAPGVKDQVEDQQHRVAGLQRREVVDQQHDGQVQEEKIRTGKDQKVTFFFASFRIPPGRGALPGGSVPL